MVYDTITKQTTLTKIGDIMDYRNVGEIEGAYTWEGRTVFISANDIADPISNTAGNSEADIYILFWYWDVTRGASGSLNYRENTHPNYNVPNNFNDRVFTDNTTNRSVIVNIDKDNFYCNGSQEFPFHSLGEAIDYYANVGTFISVQFQSDYIGFTRLFGRDVSFTQSGNKTVSLRFTDTQHCTLWFDEIGLHDCEFYKCNIYILKKCTRIAPEYDTYYKYGEVPSPIISKAYSSGGNTYILNNALYNCMVYIDTVNNAAFYADMIDLTAPGDILKYCNIIQLSLEQPS